MESIGLYIHYPFCRQKCNYCDFYTVKYKNDGQVKTYSDAVIRDIKLWGEILDKNVDTVYFGGGTPSLVDASHIYETINQIKKSFKVSDEVEVTIESNPDDLSKTYCKEIYKAGVNRISIGTQSLDKNILKDMGRTHSIFTVKEAVVNAKNAGFHNISVDFIIGILGDTFELMNQNIEFLKNYSIPHVSMYMLKIEEGTVFYKDRKNFNFLDDDTLANIYIYAIDILEKNGYSQYEISNFCIKGYESLHNLKYWECKDYLGIGPSSHSMLDNKRFYYKNGIEDFVKALGIENIVCEGYYNEVDEIIFPIRLKKGIDKNKIFQICQNANEKLDYLKTNKLINEDNGRIKLTKKGILLSNFVINYIID